MSERPTVNLFIGNREAAINTVAGGAYSCKTPTGNSLYVYFSAMEDQPVGYGEISYVTVESTGVSKEEELIIIRGLAEELGGRIGQAARHYLSNLHALNPSQEEIKKGFKTLADNNLDAIRQACENINNKG